MNEELTTVILNKLTWKSDEMDDYAEALIRAGLACVEDGRGFFNNDEVPDRNQPGDGTTVGTVTKLLCLEHILTPWRGNVPEADIWGGMRRSLRKCCHGHRNQLYTFTSVEIAEAWLERHGRRVERLQGELFFGRT